MAGSFSTAVTHWDRFKTKLSILLVLTIYMVSILLPLGARMETPLPRLGPRRPVPGIG